MNISAAGFLELLKASLVENKKILRQRDDSLVGTPGDAPIVLKYIMKEDNAYNDQKYVYDSSALINGKYILRIIRQTIFQQIE